MKRLIIDDLVNWKNSNHRKPLILKGARQIGKSFILKEFGKEHFQNFHLLDFEKEGDRLIPLFAQSLSPEKLVLEISLALKKNIDLEHDLLIFDEVQNCPRALTSLKYFNEEMPQLAICAAGSLLGITLSQESFPVGKVSFLDMYPLTFEEFILAKDHIHLVESYHQMFANKEASLTLHQVLWDYLQEYYVVGGMPEVVANFLIEEKENKYLAFINARKRQSDLVQSYKNDFKKHSGKENAIHITTVFDNIPIQLSLSHDTSVSRYKFNAVIPSKRGYADLSGPIEWLTKAGLVIKVPIISSIELPLKSYAKENLFKLFVFDVGILGAMLDLSPQSIFQNSFGSSKGYFAENFVATMLNIRHSVYSWHNKNHEIDFVIELEGNPYPIEVKAGAPTRAKSLEIVMHDYKLNKALIVSKHPLEHSDSVSHMPLYGVERV